MIRIDKTLPGGTAEGLGLKAGDQIVSVNGTEIRDTIDYQFAASEPHIELAVHTHGGPPRTLSIDKAPDDTLGIEISPFRITRCRNRCIFCFVDQMPPGCRKSLYVRDDDFRASFLYGNYITLGALSESDWQRIFRQRLSPLYVSVHTTDPALRSFMVGNKKAPDILDRLKRLADGGIRMHTQIVLCPGINDGLHLQRTVADLAGLFPAVSSIAVVPIGLTSFRTGLFPLRTFKRTEARTVILEMHKAAMQFKRRFDTRLVFASDELYIKAGLPVPPASYYEDFPQIENGVGMVADFLRQTSRTRMPSRAASMKGTVITGISFAPILRQVLRRVNSIAGVRITAVAVPNGFFGTSVTVTGLLTGGDILRALKGKRVGEVVLIPANALNEEGTTFLDDMTRADLEQSLGVRTVTVENIRDVVALIRTDKKGGA